MKKYIIILFAVASFSCGDKDEIKVIELGNEFSLDSGDTGAVLNPQITILLGEVTDSRCPEGVQCFWEGEAKVFFRFEMDGIGEVSDSLSSFNRNAVEINGITIELLDVTPYPEANSKGKKKKIARLVMRD